MKTKYKNTIEKIIKILSEKKLKISSAESCTGGLISEMITSVPGSSEIFDLGICSYSNEMKEKVLKVKHETILNFGAVSKETAKEMAQGIRNLSNSDIGVSTTGVAGPGRSENKPIGLVYIGIDMKNYSEVIKLNTNFLKSYKRTEIRDTAVMQAFDIILQNITNL